MRSSIIAPRLRTLSRASGLLCLAAVTSACSSGASRFDQVLTASIPSSSNQSQIIGGANNAQSTATTARNGIYVANRATNLPSATATQLAPAVSTTSLPAVSQVRRYPPTAGRPIVASGADAVASLSQRQALPPSAAQVRASVPSAPPAPKGAFVLAPPVQNPNVLTTGGTDPVQTSSIASNVSQATTGAPATRGWQGATAASVELKRGETLYNLSRRFGVPVSALMTANNIKNADDVQAGTRINIPSYSYDTSAPVSAPDQNPIVKASRASRGFQGQAVGKVTTPKTRAERELAERPEVLPVAPRNQNVASVGTSYTVVSGDTLYAIALKHGKSVADIQTANNMTTTNVRLGQRLVIPGRVDRSATASIPKAQSQQVGPVVTKKPAAKKPVQTASASAAAGFLWPAQGKILSRFGERGPQGSNDGIDISLPVGTPVKAARSGTVIYSGSELEDFGKLILVSHNDGWVSAYAHASQTLVSRGDKVSRGQVIAKSGKTGNTTVPKLHFELRKNSNPQNPMSHLPR
ncbi:peptidoglycan DD-metalloendopeptidase family protein [Ahrensia sp. R2A130]|uniref:peptidoglycan DD-metalloendopeptidase family protein n=1 Tax=Ahrensia sp. R2A130 TaxID=744979 RepID=UPI0001E0E06E|nr:peptidoglycan DD-metalloendopeptidase family protein [Ahrensia sp. R2A130]EFL90377.1 peptidase M23B [Ahrensia sp. R2A130]